MRAYAINLMVVLIIFPVILQAVINVIMLSIGGQGKGLNQTLGRWSHQQNWSMPGGPVSTWLDDHGIGI